MPTLPQIRDSTGVDHTITAGNSASTGIVVRDGTSDHMVSSGYAKTSTTDILFYERINTLYPGGTWSKRGSMLSETTGPDKIICRETNGRGDSSAVYIYADVTKYTYLKMDIRIYFCPRNGQVLVGIGNFDSFDIYKWPTITNGWAYDQGNTIKEGNYGLVYGTQNTPLHFNINIQNLTGTKCIGLCAVSRSSVQATSHVACTKIWME